MTFCELQLSVSPFGLITSYFRFVIFEVKDDSVSRSVHVRQRYIYVNFDVMSGCDTTYKKEITARE